ncbi:hypothetical protein EA462_02505 [Natrarchaeobius halalkaliphilus]|uniref:DUF7344 domain-containing protein n=1 Tax=Natrarchaeobius halalkaliphilus TaxID=1679091 RepID=A0A3N6LYY5_9EURY|nr:hypothetical protein [Natrarchaeobius halalkaliphilus]RQG93094.1 hypothetical protein EA462_02505 [Natrarchaeobius halalkaliphilus]
MSDDTRRSTQSSEEMFESIENISPDTVFDLLSHRHRRIVIELLVASDGVLTIRDLRNEIIEKEQGVEITEGDKEQIEQVFISLYHIHIPKLAEEGIVNYDQERTVVEPTEKLSNLVPFLSQL